MSSEVTVLIRTFNSDRTLEACLESVHSQTCDAKAIVVVDTGSTDDTLEIAEDHGAEIIHYPDEPFNYSRAINLGMEQVETSHVLILSSHVMLPSARTLEVMQRLLTEDKKRCAASIRGYASSPSEVDTEEVEWELVTEGNFISEYRGIGITNSCNLIPYEFWTSHPFDESIPGCEDQKWLQYHLEQGRVAVQIHQPQMVYKNLYYSKKKTIHETVTLAKYGINPSLTEWSSLGGRVYEAISGLWKGEKKQFYHQLYLFWELLKVRLGFGKEISSKSFSTVNES